MASRCHRTPRNTSLLGRNHCVSDIDDRFDLSPLALVGGEIDDASDQWAEGPSSGGFLLVPELTSQPAVKLNMRVWLRMADIRLV